MVDPILETERLTKRFDGLTAVSNVSLAFKRGCAHAIIGPNGAGKTTFLNLLSGELLPSAGRIRLRGRDITGAPPDHISRLKVGRSFQRANIFPGFTCFECCWVAAQSRLNSSMRFFRPARRLAGVRARAERALDGCGLTPRRDSVATTLSYGEQRQLEIAMLLATEPELLLLDEPLAGMGPEESSKMVMLLKRLVGDQTLIMIEHDMDAVFAIADSVTVMVNGEVVESGTVEQIRHSPVVQKAYLGTEDAA